MRPRQARKICTDTRCTQLQPCGFRNELLTQEWVELLVKVYNSSSERRRRPNGWNSHRIVQKWNDDSRLLRSKVWQRHDDSRRLPPLRAAVCRTKVCRCLPTLHYSAECDRLRGSCQRLYSAIISHLSRASLADSGCWTPPRTRRVARGQHARGQAVASW